MSDLPQRAQLHHKPPAWVQRDSLFFLTVCCAPRGKSQLNNAAAFAAITESIDLYVRSGKWWIESFLAMPDHWHALIAFPDIERMEKVIRDWKRYIAKQATITWQGGFFEHRLRSTKSANEKWHYILNNPVRKGLVSDSKDWPYIWLPSQTNVKIIPW
jgi:putative transposase